MGKAKQKEGANQKDCAGLPGWSSGLELCIPNAEGAGSISGQGTRSHMLQLKILRATTEA